MMKCLSLSGCFLQLGWPSPPCQAFPLARPSQEHSFRPVELAQDDFRILYDPSQSSSNGVHSCLSKFRKRSMREQVR